MWNREKKLLSAITVLGLVSFGAMLGAVCLAIVAGF